MRMAGVIAERLTGSGKKTAVAVGLMGLMAFMWVRVLLGHRPDAAGAAPEAPADRSPAKRSVVQARIIELPKVPGRHDCIASDFFTLRDRTGLLKATNRTTGTTPEVQTTPEERAQEVIRRIAQRLRVESVLRTDNPQAFVNDRLVNVGDRFTIREGSDSYEFEVQKIHNDGVLVECNGIRLTLKLAQSLEVND